ncbi:hypothetical protein [Melaminivora jejuensis]|uniref:hypothetical protein n=1 Tax=Melaminivora jejuensis TaxID=1267217 RepID=UPI001E6339B7|nr:hypothetical protein [Melaminivora jejuensis]UHJ66420.1 hypothetical protein LVC68_07910 [Melaminivora jejuensis]
MTLLLMARGLLGDAVAMGLTLDAGALPPAAAVSPAQHCGGRADTGHCAEPQGHSACATCGLCHPAPLAPSPGLASPAAAPAAPPAERSARFASAHRTRAIRPPIAAT